MHVLGYAVEKISESVSMDLLSVARFRVWHSVEYHLQQVKLRFQGHVRISVMTASGVLPKLLPLMVDAWMGTKQLTVLLLVMAKFDSSSV